MAPQIFQKLVLLCGIPATNALWILNFSHNVNFHECFWPLKFCNQIKIQLSCPLRVLRIIWIGLFWEVLWLLWKDLWWADIVSTRQLEIKLLVKQITVVYVWTISWDTCLSFIISYQILCFAEEAKQQITPRYLWWRLWDSQKVSAVIGG